MESQKIIWAVDPYAEDPAALRSAAWSLRSLTKGMESEIVPVYISGSGPLEVPIPITPKVVAGMTKKGQDEIDVVLSRIKLKSVKPFKVLHSDTRTRHEDANANALLAYARSEGASLIVLTSHGRKGLERFLMGSFAETLVLGADIPVYVVHPGLRRAPELKSILFATDFSDESLQAFDRVLEFAASRGSRVYVYHRMGAPSYLTLEPVYLPAELYQKEYDNYAQAMAAKGRSMVERAALLGVKAEFILSKRSRGTTAASIAARARKLDAMIALASRSGAFASAFLGSISRQVLRVSEQPVWLIHPGAKVLAKPAPVLRGLPGGRSQSEHEPSAIESFHKDLQSRIL